jgi:myotubularin-related protein 6/7/8
MMLNKRRYGSVTYATNYAILRLRYGQVPYPLMSLVTRLPQTLQGRCPLTFHTRTFETFSLVFDKDVDAHDVFESVKELTVAGMPHFVSVIILIFEKKYL